MSGSKVSEKNVQMLVRKKPWRVIYLPLVLSPAFYSPTWSRYALDS